MSIATALIALSLLGADGEKIPWKLAAEDNGIKIYSRMKDGENVAEMRAMGEMDAAPIEVWKAVRDYEGYSKNMPFTEYGKVLSRTEGDKVIFFHSVVNTPLVDKRDYIIRLQDESDAAKGVYRVTWRAATAADGVEIPAEKEGVVRVKLNNGFWQLEPREGGKKTFATYYVHTDPGGSIPKMIANKGNTMAVPKVFEKIRDTVAAERAKAKK
jgi:hypothetical protein